MVIGILIVSGVLYIVSSAGADRNFAPEIKELSRLMFLAAALAWLFGH
jgi:hypothetical protein